MDKYYIYYPIAMLILMLLFFSLLPLIFLLFLGIVGRAFVKVGLTPFQTWILLLTSLVGSAVNIPVAEKKTYQLVDQVEVMNFFRIQLPPIKVERRIVIAVNLGGAIIPTIFSLYLLYRVGLRLGILASLLLVIIVSYVFSKPIRGVGIAMPFYIAPIAAALGSLFFAPHLAGISAYVSGTLGTLIGADLLRLKDIDKIGSGFVSIGGAGVFDGIFLSEICLNVSILFNRGLQTCGLNR